MHTTIEQLHALMTTEESEHIEFKKATIQFDSDKLTRYCVAMANEGGGKIVFGVSDKKPRKVIGTMEYPNIEKTKKQLLDRLHLRIDIEEIAHPDGRVVIIHVPSRPIGRPMEYHGAYWMRSGESLVPMTPEKLQQIFAEAEPDFSAQVCKKANFDDLEPNAIELFREKWRKRSGNQGLSMLSTRQLLEDAELTVDGEITNAALILFGTRKGLGRYLAQSEVVFEYRSSETSLAFQQRKEYREGFFSYQDDLWQTINLRNDNHQYQDGLFMLSIPTFSESVIREAILNAVSHRDYRLAGSVFIRQYPKRIELISPGGFPPGITAENILWKQYPRNRRIAEVFSKCGLVERSGQGANRMFEQCARESKLPPDFSGTDDYQVFLTLYGEVRDINFLKFLEKIGLEKQVSFDSSDFILLDLINRDMQQPQWARQRASILRKLGIIEYVNKKYMLSRKFYEFADKRGAYTRKRGLDRNTNKQLLLQHIHDNKKSGSKLRDLHDVLPTLTKHQVQKLLAELKRENLVNISGKTSSAKWFPRQTANGKESA